jgi:hypothetical protein
LSKKKCEQQGNDDLEVCVWNLINEKKISGKKMFSA